MIHMSVVHRPQHRLYPARLPAAAASLIIPQPVAHHARLQCHPRSSVHTSILFYLVAWLVLPRRLALSRLPSR